MVTEKTKDLVRRTGLATDEVGGHLRCHEQMIDLVYDSATLWIAKGRSQLALGVAQAFNKAHGIHFFQVLTVSAVAVRPIVKCR